MKGVKITNIDCNEIEVEVELYYCDKEYFDPKDNSTSGDMGFAFCEQSETKNQNSLAENIDGMKWWAENNVRHCGIMDDEVEILYLCKGKFVGYVYANEYDSRYDDDNIKISKSAALRMVKEHFDISSVNLIYDDETDEEIDKRVYALAICSPKVGKELELEKHLSMKVHYYNPNQVSNNFKSVEENLLTIKRNNN